MNNALKFLNIVAIFTLVVLCFAIAARAEEHHCKIKTGDVGDFHYRALTLEEAMSKTSEACLDARLKLHEQVKGVEADEDRAILYMEKCVNDNVCWEK